MGPRIIYPRFTATEQKVLNLLKTMEGRIVTHEALCVHLFGCSGLTERNNIGTHIHRIRAKGVEVTTVFGVGYTLGDGSAVQELP